MKFLNQYSFVLIVIVALLVFGSFILRGGLKLEYLVALAALSIGFVLAYRFLNPGAGSSATSESVLAEIQSGSPVLLEFQSPY